MGSHEPDSPRSASKLKQPPSLLIEKKIRLTPATAARVQAYRASRDDKPEADCLRDLVFAGLEALNVQRVAVAGSIAPGPLTKAA